LNASLHAREIVRKLLIFARLMPPKKALINLNKVVEEGLYLFESRCKKEGIELIRDLSLDLPEVHADPSQLNQVLVNLVINAVQAMPSGGRLTLRTLHEEDHVSLMVEDTGTGMDGEVLKKIFTPFFTTKDVGQGTGLGLPVVHGIVTSHGGSINVESDVNQGSRFEIKLPLIRSQEMLGNNPDGLRR
jgi:signal transduction histidine kinase